jgi:hypothetical protein
LFGTVEHRMGIPEGLPYSVSRWVGDSTVVVGGRRWPVHGLFN